MTDTSHRSRPAAKIAVVGGSGLYNMPGLSDTTDHTLDTPYGPPSAPVRLGNLRGRTVAFLPRHGLGHTLPPHQVPYRANIYALKMLGVRFVISVNACGSLREALAPGHLVVPDQLFDFTKSERGGRTFFDVGLVGHVSVADPLCPTLSGVLAQAVAGAGGTVHQGGTFITVEGPRFSTKGESRVFRAWGCDIIGMTTCPEAFLAAEAEMSYAVLAHITDYDVWHTSEAPVTADAVMQTLHANLDVVQHAVAAAVEALDEDADLPAHHSMAHALMTAPERIHEEARTRLGAIVGHHLA